MNKILIAPFRRTEAAADGTVIVSGVASTESRDSAGEIVLASAIEAALPAFRKAPALREMHASIAAGKVTSITVKGSQTLIEALVVDPGTVRKVQLGVLRSFSIGGSVLGRDPKDATIITRLRLSEISLVDTPANADCTISAVKVDRSVTLWKADDRPSGPVQPAGVQTVTAAELDGLVAKALADMPPEQRALLLAKAALRVTGREILPGMPWRR